MAKKKSISTKNSLSLFVLGILALIILVGAFALQQSNGFSLFPRASTLSGSGSTNSYMCQERCAANTQCGNGQICGVKPGSGTAQKFCYNPSCPDSQQCGGEGCGGECRAIDSREGKDIHTYLNENQCLTRCAIEYPGRICMAWNGSPHGKNSCITNLCRFDGIQLRSHYMDSGGDYKGANYIRVHKKNTCPAHNYSLCENGFKCETTDDEIIITKLTDTVNGWARGRIGMNCLCESNELFNDGSSQEILHMEYCDEQYTYNFEDLNHVGESISCSLTTKQCVRN